MSFQTSILDLIEQGERLKEAGMQLALDHADGISPQWSVKAYQLFCAWISEKGKGRQFKTEDFRIHVELTEAINKPPSARAYGSLATKAAKQGLIKKIGHATVTNPKAHRCFASLWEVA